jgi:hypothetical protein
MSQGGKAAKLHYMANGFRILVHGDHVNCAVSGAPITLESLRYWSVIKQEAYASPEIATQAALA